VIVTDSVPMVFVRMNIKPLSTVVGIKPQMKVSKQSPRIISTH
jgi:hypothetical protein